MKKYLLHIFVAIIVCCAFSTHANNKFNECIIEGKFDMGAYADKGELIILLNKLENGTLIIKKYPIKLNENGSFNLKLETGSFSIGTFYFSYINGSQSWRGIIYFYLNGSETINLEAKALNKRIILNESKIKDENILALSIFEKKIAKKESSIWKNCPKEDQAKEYAESFLSLGDSILNHFKTIDEDLKDYITFTARANYLKNLYKFPTIFRKINRRRFNGSSDYFVTKYNEIEIFDSKFFQFFSGASRTLLKGINKEVDIKGLKGLDAIQKKMDFIRKNLKNQHCKNELYESMLNTYKYRYQCGNYEDDLKRFEKMASEITNPETRDELIEGFRTIKNSFIGSDLPSIEIEDRDGKKSNLKDLLSGEYLYVDLWASW